MGVFFFSYGTARIFVEIFREPDSQYVSIENPLGYILFLPGNMGLTMGQSLSIPMVAAGIFFVLMSYRRVTEKDL